MKLDVYLSYSFFISAVEVSGCSDVSHIYSAGEKPMNTDVIFFFLTHDYSSTNQAIFALCSAIYVNHYSRTPYSYSRGSEL